MAELPDSFVTARRNSSRSRCSPRSSAVERERSRHTRTANQEPIGNTTVAITAMVTTKKAIMKVTTRVAAAVRPATVSLIATALFAILLVLVLTAWSPLMTADIAVLNGLHAHALKHPAFVATMKTISNAGSAPVYTVLFTGITAWLLYRRRFRQATFVAVAEIGGGLLNSLLKFLVHRPRPLVLDPVAQASGLSFPSGHAQSAAVAATVLLVVFAGELNRAGRFASYYLAVLAVGFVGFSRVALSVHYVSDVLAGFCAGIAWATCVLILTDRAWAGR
ncbi:phosphatase PAP2 family protein [Lentzea sp. NPDC058436]|uniref:phosphatase PAP2 family protein n=1 Tax=Lentzea sp. NPDC058436 TaxID=3346499 RepID=UPI00365B663D